MTAVPGLRLLHVTDEPPTPSFFLRFREPAEALGLSYLTVRAVVLFNGRLRRYGDARFEHMPATASADVVLFQRTRSIEAGDLFDALKHAGKPLIYETDDFFIELPPWSGVKLSGTEKVSVARMITGADLVCCSTAALAERLGEINENVRVIENYALALPVKEIVARHARGPHVAVVNTDYFKLIEGKAGFFRALDRAVRNLGYRVTCIGTISSEMQALAASHPDHVSLAPIWIPWHRQFIRHLDTLGVNVAMVPLEQDPAHIYKSDVKFADFGSLGIPGVYNNTDVYKRVVHRENGFICDGTEEDWYAGLAFLADSATRRRCGEAAHATVSQRTLEDYALEFEAAIASVLPVATARSDANP